MKIIYKKRCKGKTTMLIKEAIKAKGFLLVRDYVKKTYLEKAYPELKEKVFIWNQFPSFLMGKEEGKLFIDDADMFLSYLTHYNIGCIAINKQE